MANDNPIRFTLSDATIVTVRKMTNNTYDFEMKFSNGNRKTFRWSANGTYEFNDRKGKKDKIITEAIEQLLLHLG